MKQIKKKEYNKEDFQILYPFVPRDYLSLPPTILSVMESICELKGMDADNMKIKDIITNSRSEIFDFEYPLDAGIGTKEFFETQILKHFIDRRIGFETMTLFKFKLETKLNEIMPVYNKYIESFVSYHLSGNEEESVRGTNNKNIDSETHATDSTTASQTQTQNSSSTNDNRYSDTPENRISDVQSGAYMTNYTYNQGTGNITNNNNSSGSGESSGTSETTHAENYQETRTKSGNKLDILAKYMNEIKPVMTEIYKNLDELFFQLI